MSNIIPVNISKCSFDIHKDLSVFPRERKPGPPIRIDGMTVGIVTMEHSAPHGGEVHPDGDEILVVIFGKVKVTGDSAPDKPLELTAGESCIVKAGEWHKVEVSIHAQCLSNFRNRCFRPLVRHHRSARDDPQGANLGQLRGKGVRHPIHEILLLRITYVLERQDSE